MSMKVKVKIENLDREIEMEVGEDLRSALLENDIDLYGRKFAHRNCHGHGMCTKCQVEVREGESACSDQSVYERARVGSKRRLACQTRVYQDIVIETLHEVPQEVY